MRQRGIFTLSAACFVLLFLSGCVVVEDGTVGISKSFGEINDDQLLRGVYASVPLVREVEVWNIKTQRRSLNVDMPSAEGLIVKLQTSVLYRPQAVIRLRKEVGAGFVQVVLESTLVDVFREVIGNHKVEEIITNQDNLTTLAFERLKVAMHERGILIEDLMVTGLELPPTFKDAVERKLEQEQKALQKHFELEQAVKDAEIEVARAKGSAQAQEIVRSTLSREYLDYLWISTLNQNPNVIYVATEANVPLFRTTQEQHSGKPAKAAADAGKAALTRTSEGAG